MSASILAITDDPMMKDLLLEMALHDDFGIRCASSEVETTRLLHREHPDVLLTDLDMSARTNMKFLRTLRQSLYRDIPYVTVTTNNDPMLSITVDTPIFYKPNLDNLDAILERMFARKSDPTDK